MTTPAPAIPPQRLLLSVAEVAPDSAADATPSQAFSPLARCLPNASADASAVSAAPTSPPTSDASPRAPRHGRSVITDTSTRPPPGHHPGSLQLLNPPPHDELNHEENGTVPRICHCLRVGC